MAPRAAVTQAASRQRSSGKSGLLDPADIIRDPDTGLAIDGREQLMFLLSNEVMRELVTTKNTPSEEDVTRGTVGNGVFKSGAMANLGSGPLVRYRRLNGRGMWCLVKSLAVNYL